MLNTGPHWEKYSSTREMIETVGMVTGLQFLVALVTMRYLVPLFLEGNRRKLFLLLLFILLIVASEINILIRYFYLEPLYPDSYTAFLKNFGHMTLTERMSLFWTLRYIIFNKLPLFLFPTALLVAHNFFQQQQTLLRIREQKRTAELDALKNQLNPHFIFNTLNNIYALSLKKSEQTPVAIEKLSGILDYVVYRCNDKFVPLSAEAKLIENYIALEKIRYGKRLNITFKNQATAEVKIAPLILLTLLENACKHSTQEELHTATVSIDLSTENGNIIFVISNTKPQRIQTSELKLDTVGLANLKKQLALLYPNAHSYDVEETSSHYTSRLSVIQK